MALEGILEKIRTNAHEQAEAIREEGRLKRREILAKAESLAREIADRIGKEGMARAELERNRASVSAELEYRKEILKEKQSLVQECFQAALDELVNLPAGEYQALLRKMLLKLATGARQGILISPEDEQKIDQLFIDGVNNELRQAGAETQLKLDGTSPKIRGGFILRTDEVEVDCSFGTLLAQLREESQAEVAAALFGGKK